MKNFIKNYIFYLTNKELIDATALKDKKGHYDWQRKVNFYWACVYFSKDHVKKNI